MYGDSFTKGDCYERVYGGGFRGSPYVYHPANTPRGPRHRDRPCAWCRPLSKWGCRGQDQRRKSYPRLSRYRHERFVGGTVLFTPHPIGSRWGCPLTTLVTARSSCGEGQDTGRLLPGAAERRARYAARLIRV